MLIKGDNCCPNCIANFNIGRHLHICKPICFKLGMTIDTAELNSLMTVCVALLQMKCGMLLRLVDLMNILLSCLINIHGREPNLGDGGGGGGQKRKEGTTPPPPTQKKQQHYYAFRHLQTDFFQTWCDDRHHCTVLFNIRLNSLDLH